MKIFKIAMIFVSIMAFISSVSFAASVATDTTGGQPLVIAANGILPALSFTPSPNTIMAVESTATAFAATSASTKTTTDNGIMYGVLSSASPIYQLTQTVTAELVAPSSAISLGNTWKDKSGNTAP